VITAADTNVLLDILRADDAYGPPSKSTLKQSLREGAVIACEVVWAEVASQFSDLEQCAEALAQLSVGFDPIDERSAFAAGAGFRAYRHRRGPRVRVLPDFLIAAHAASKADRLLTRDRGFYRAYFPDLVVLDPATP
jgi:predicted nucleic acid-binding protein